MKRKFSAFEVGEQLNLPPKEHIIDYKMNETKDGKINKLYANLMLPSYVHGYSLAIEYMTKWFESKFEKDFFKSIYIDGKHVIDDYKKFSKLMVKGENPRARIEPRVQFDYDMETVDLYQAPPQVYIRRSRWQDSFFKDFDRNLFLSFNARGLRMDFNFKVRVNTRSQQLDTFNKMELAFRVGATDPDEISVDFHVPKEIMLIIAQKAGFAIKDGVVLETIEFLKYLNKHSDIPFLFKLRAINKKPEYFVRIKDLYRHIAIHDKLQMDDGERDGKLDFNFHIEMVATLTIPIPHFYVLYGSEDFSAHIHTREPDVGTVSIYTVNLLDIPHTDEHNWPEACITDYLPDKGDTEIDISTLFTGENILNKVINHDLLLGVSPEHFINIKLYREDDLAKHIPFTMDWKRMVMKFEHPLPEEVMHIVIYYDRLYVNELEVNMNDYNENRVGKDKK